MGATPKAESTAFAPLELDQFSRLEHEIAGRKSGFHGVQFGVRGERWRAAARCACCGAFGRYLFAIAAGGPTPCRRSTRSGIERGRNASFDSGGQRSPRGDVVPSEVCEPAPRVWCSLHASRHRHSDDGVGQDANVRAGSRGRPWRRFRPLSDRGRPNLFECRACRGRNRSCCRTTRPRQRFRARSCGSFDRPSRGLPGSCVARCFRSDIVHRQSALCAPSSHRPKMERLVRRDCSQVWRKRQQTCRSAHPLLLQDPRTRATGRLWRIYYSCGMARRELRRRAPAFARRRLGRHSRPCHPPGGAAL